MDHIGEREREKKKEKKKLVKGLRRLLRDLPRSLRDIRGCARTVCDDEDDADNPGTVGVIRCDY